MGSEWARDAAMCKVIETIVIHTNLSAMRNEATEDTPCAISLVAKALDNNPRYDGVKRVWIERHKRKGSDLNLQPWCEQKFLFTALRNVSTTLRWLVFDFRLGLAPFSWAG